MKTSPLRSMAFLGANLGARFGTLVRATVLTGLVATLIPSSALANQTQIFGADFGGKPVLLPNPVCAMPGHVLKVYADAVDNYGRRYFLALENFVWQLTRQNQHWDRWSANYSWAYGPFTRSRQNTQMVYVAIPQDLGAFGNLAAGTNGAYDFVLRVVDPRSGYACTWAPHGVYHDPYAQPAPIPPAPPAPPVPAPMPSGIPQYP